MVEKWIPGQENRYTVTEDGIVTSYVQRMPRTMKWKVPRDGYPRVSISPGDGSLASWQMVHRLILLAHVGPAPEGMVARHLNGDPLKPHLSQLAWGTQSDNLKDKRGHGTDHNAIKTHCPQGHAYTEENTYRRPGRPDHRECKACNRAAARRYQSRKKEVAP